MYTRVLSACLLLGGLSSFGVSFIRGFTVHRLHVSFTSSVLLTQVLCEEGLVLFRDYGLYDHAQLRFGRGHKIEENFYMRQDGTRAYYFSEGIHCAACALLPLLMLI